MVGQTGPWVWLGLVGQAGPDPGQIWPPENLYVLSAFFFRPNATANFPYFSKCLCVRTTRLNIALKHLNSQNSLYNSSNVCPIKLRHKLSLLSQYKRYLGIHIINIREIRYFKYFPDNTSNYLMNIQR